MEVDDNSALIVGNPQGILGQQLRHKLINLLCITAIFYLQRSSFTQEKAWRSVEICG
jgi:hypothetical protein